MARPHHLLFVCSGNICRSPLGEYIARAYCESTGVEAVCRSAGTLGLVDRPADPTIIRVGKEIQLDLSAHRSQGITRELVGWADHVLVMERLHAGHVAELGAEADLLGRYVGKQEIADPIGAWFTWTFRACRKEIEEATRRFVDTLPSDLP